MVLNRIGRIKCDEVKPACLKCTSTGRDGEAAAKADLLHTTQAGISAPWLSPSTAPNELSVQVFISSAIMFGLWLPWNFRSEFWDATTALSTFDERLPTSCGIFQAHNTHSQWGEFWIQRFPGKRCFAELTFGHLFYIHPHCVSLG